MAYVEDLADKYDTSKDREFKTTKRGTIIISRVRAVTAGG